MNSSISQPETDAAKETALQNSVPSDSTGTIKIRFNNQIIHCPQNITVSELLQRELDNSLGVAVTLNYIVVPQTQWTSSVLYENDILDCFMAIAGG